MSRDGSAVCMDVTHVALWQPAGKSPLVARSPEQVQTDLALGQSVTARKDWALWINELAFSWLVIGGLACVLPWSLRRRPGWMPVFHQSLTLAALCFVSLVAWFNVAGPRPIAAIGLVCAWLLIGRAAAAPERGVPWLGMASGLRPMGATLLSLLLLAWVVTVSTMTPVRFGITQFLLALFVCTVPPLCLARGEERVAWAKYLGLVGIAFSAGEAFNELFYVVLELIRGRALMFYLFSVGIHWVIHTIVWLLLIALAVPIARLCRRLFGLS